MPAARIFGPPMPTNRAPGKRARSALMRCAPSRSPEASPATMPIVTGGPDTVSSLSA